LDLLKQTVTEPLWDFGDICAERRQSLMAPFDFDRIIEAIRSEARNIRYEKDKGTHKGSWRPIFRFDVCEETFDRFFNSPYGYRGQYLADPEEGRKKDSMLVSALVDTLVHSIRGELELLNQIRLSLASAHAKIWIEEDQHNPRTPDLIVEIRVLIGRRPQGRCTGDWLTVIRLSPRRRWIGFSVSGRPLAEP
jgi:hypothetical protein